MPGVLAPGLVGYWRLERIGSNTELIAGYPDMPDANWPDYNIPSTNEEVTHDGQTNCRHIVADAGHGSTSSLFTTGTGIKYQWSMKVKVISGSVLIRLQRGNGNFPFPLTGSINPASWTTYSGFYAERAGGGLARIRNESESEAGEYYVDEVSFKEIGVFDASGNENHGIADGPTLGAGLRGKGYLFDGGDDFINITTTAALRPTKITVSAWVKSTGAGTGNRQIASSDNNVQRNWQFRFGDNAGDDPSFLIFVGNSPFNATWVTTLSENIWHYLTGTYDGTNIKLYVNGVERASTPQSGDLDQDAANINIGRLGDGNQWFKGSIDEVMVWNEARTKAQIQTDMMGYVQGGM